jgi:putative oxidoreductase
MPAPGKEFENALLKVGYFFPFMKTVEVVCGMFLLINRYTAFFLLLIFPVL